MPKILGYVVTCHICNARYDEQDPAVRWRYVDHVWECYDEAACFERRANPGLVPPGGDAA